MAEELSPCDLVMKGGITSGVVYPKLIAHLSDKYRFKSIGGTSAGALAAAACAAAEFGRQNGHEQAFDRLGHLPAELGTDIGTPAASMLFHLFQPTRALHKHFAVLVSALNANGRVAAAVGVLRSMLLRFWGFTLLAFAVALMLLTPVVIATTAWALPSALAVAAALLVGWAVVPVFLLRHVATPAIRVVMLLLVGGATMFTAVRYGGAAMYGAAWLVFVCAVVVCQAATLAVLLASWRFAVTLLAGLEENFHGMCSGRTVPDQASGAAGLTDWLTGYLNELAGLQAMAPPLTFGELWAGERDAAASGAELPAAASDTPRRERVLNLQVMTTAVTQQMCYSIPFRDGSSAFYYDPAEWARLFPETVMKWLTRASVAESVGQQAVKTAAGVVLARLPSNRRLPVVVAVRMSLSFPVLLSAVPLYAIDFSVDEPRVKRVWFSDGGISSNMPLHFFDAPLPRHPTFAVNLKDPHPKYPIDRDKRACEQAGRVYLPSDNAGGQVRYWRAPEERAPHGVFRFLWSIVTTMQNWRDEIQFPYPGYRDRIVQISQLADEGGLNLNMPRKNMEALSDAGEYAAERLVQRFHPTSIAPQRGGWHKHQELRLSTFLGIIEELVVDPCVADPLWDAVVNREGRYTKPEADLAKAVLIGLRALGEQFKKSGVSLARKAPRPRADMRVAPRI